MAILGEESYLTFKLVDNLLADDKSETDSLGIDTLLFVLDSAKHLEHSLLVLFLNSQPIVSYRDPQKVVDNLYHNRDLSLSISELHSV